MEERQALAIALQPEAAAHRPAVAYTVPGCFSYLLLFVQLFSAFCPIERPSIGEAVGWDQATHGSGMEGDTGRARRHCRGAGCRRQKFAAGVEVELGSWKHCR